MKKLSLTEFKEYCAGIPAKRYLFSSEYQADDSPFGLELTFEQSYILVSVFLAPNTIAFQNDKRSQLVFEGVKYVNVAEERVKNGIKCEIVCNTEHTGCCETTYVIVIV